LRRPQNTHSGERAEAPTAASPDLVDGADDRPPAGDGAIADGVRG